MSGQGAAGAPAGFVEVVTMGGLLHHLAPADEIPLQYTLCGYQATGFAQERGKLCEMCVTSAFGRARVG